MRAPTIRSEKDGVKSITYYKNGHWVTISGKKKIDEAPDLQTEVYVDNTKEHE